jgi:competence protein ComGC
MVNKNGRTIFETLVVLILVLLLLGVFATYLKKTVRIAHEYSLASELSNIRSSVTLYLVINKRYPKSLNQLLEEELILPFKDFKIIDKSYLKAVSTDESGSPLDPFGNKFGYNPKSGHVWTTTIGYKGW